MERIVGIDLGTTNSVISLMENGEPIVIRDKRGERLTPSVVSFTKDGETLVGRTAKNQAILNSENTITSIKRKMGTEERIKVMGKDFSPVEISTEILKKLKQDAEEYLGTEVKKAIITVPAYFNDNQRQATKDAGRIAGLEVSRIINEPTAAALSYGLNKEINQKVLIYDLGGGTFDVSILEIADGVFEVLSTCGNNKLGGDDFDQALLKLVLDQFKEREKIDLSEDKMALQKLRDEVEKAKIDLSERDITEINVPFISADETGPKHLNIEVKRNQFEDLIQDYVDETIALIEKAVNEADLSFEDIDQVLLVGGSTRIPVVQRRVEELTGKPLTKGINPDECVAIGAAIQAGILSGDAKGIVLVDVTPLSLGIEIEGGIFVPVIERNTTIPTTAKKLFTTIADNQKNVEIHILQGERPRCEDNISLGKFMLTGIRTAKKGEPRIEVTFNIDVDGIVHVSAMDLDTGSHHEIQITNTTSLSEDEILELIEEAKKNQNKDKAIIEIDKLIRKITKKKEILNKIYSENRDNIDKSLQDDIEKLFKETEQKLDSLEKEKLKELLELIEFSINEINAELDNDEEKNEEIEKDTEKVNS